MNIIRYEDTLSGKHVARVVKIINAGGVVVYPTDTLYGIGGNFFSLPVHQAVDRIKNRSDMPYSAAVANLNMFHQLVDVDSVPPVFYKLYQELLPGKFTFLFKVSGSLDPALVKGGDKIGIRVPGAAILLKLIEILNFPLITTSVNRSGEPPLNDPQKIMQAFPDTAGDAGVSLLLDGGPLPPSKGSTILDMTTSPITCLRKGDDFDRLREMEVV
jgi:L-threonylcarbamoyladenylate synthase